VVVSGFVSINDFGAWKMPEKNINLHGSAPDKHKFALLLIDVINDFDFAEADQLLKYTRPMARNLLRLKRRAQKAGVPVVYVNDNFGRWKSDFRRTVEHCALHGRGREVVELLRPEENDYFVLKPKHSGFFSTTLETLLRYLETQTLILTGIAGNFCVLFTANDAYMRDFNLFVPLDCTVSNTKKGNDSALALMRKFLKADTRSSSGIALRAAQKKSQKRPGPRR
jgi:nicotinamidase-related amidase